MTHQQIPLQLLDVLRGDPGGAQVAHPGGQPVYHLAGGDQAVDHRPDALQAGLGGGVELDPRPVAGHAYHVAAGKRGTVQAQAHGVNFTSRRLGDRMSPNWSARALILTPAGAWLLQQFVSSPRSRRSAWR